jgi:hypothetical protein
MFDQLYTVPNIKNLSDPLNHVALTEQSRQFLAINEAQAMLCHEHMDVEDLKYMGTSTVVRDIDFMAQKFDGKGAKMCNTYALKFRRVLTNDIVTTGEVHTAPSLERTWSTCRSWLSLTMSLVNMLHRLPDRIGRSVIDGVADVITWASQ